VFEQFAGDDNVEAGVVEVQRLVEICPVRFDSQLRCRGEGFSIGIDADDLVAVGIRPAEAPVAATQVEDLAAGPTDVATKEFDAFGAREDEPCATFHAVVLGVALAQLLEAHQRRA